MKLNKALQKFVSQAKQKDSYWVEKAKLDFAISLEKKRKSIGMTYSSIAEKMGTSKAYITKVFRGDANLTIESMVKLSRATGSRLHINLIDESLDVKPSVWAGIAANKTASNHHWFTGTTEIHQPSKSDLNVRYG